MGISNPLDRIEVGDVGWDVVVAGLVFTVALVLFPLRFYVSQFFVEAIPVVVGVASGGYLLLERKEFESGGRYGWRFGPTVAHMGRLGVLVGLAGMVLVGTLAGGRTIAFFAVAALVGALVFAQILLVREDALGPVPVLVQVVAFAAVVRWTALLTTPGLIGVDAWRHLPDYAHSIRAAGGLWPISDTKYFSAPLYHLLVVAAADALGASLRTALYATLGVVMPLAAVLVYYTGRLLLPVRWALFAAATFAVADHVVRWGIHLIPTSMGLVFFLGVVFGTVKLATHRSTITGYLLVLGFAVAAILTHQISAAVVVVFIAAGAAVQVYARLSTTRIVPGTVEGDAGSVNFVALVLVVLPLTLLDWSYAPRDGPSFLADMLESTRTSLASASLLALESVTTVDTGPIAAVLVSVPPHVQVLDSLGFLVLLLVALLGSFAVLRYGALEALQLTWLSASGAMLVVVLAMPLFGLYFLIPMRWYAFLYVPLVLLAAYGLQYLDARMPLRALVTAFVVLALVFPGAMLVNHKATPEDPVAGAAYSQFALDRSERQAAGTIATIHPEGAPLQADHPYFLYLRNAELMTPAPHALDDRARVGGSTVIYRQHQTDRGSKAEYRGEMVRVQLSADAVCRRSMEVRYSNGDVLYCTVPGGG